MPASCRFGVLSLFLLALTPHVGACADDNLPTAAQVQNDLRTALKVGDSSEKIESFFRNRSLPTTYDKYGRRYESIIRSPTSNFRAVVIYVNVDAEKRFLTAEAHDSFTMP
jgi:hypothetical protein